MRTSVKNLKLFFFRRVSRHSDFTHNALQIFVICNGCWLSFLCQVSFRSCNRHKLLWMWFSATWSVSQIPVNVVQCHMKYVTNPCECGSVLHEVCHKPLWIWFSATWSVSQTPVNMVQCHMKWLVTRHCTSWKLYKNPEISIAFLYLALYLDPSQERSQNCEKRLFVSLHLSVSLSVLLSVRMKQIGSHWTYFHETWCLNFNLWCSVIFRKSAEKIHVPLKSDKITCALFEDLCTFMTVFRWIFLRMRNISGSICREN